MLPILATVVHKTMEGLRLLILVTVKENDYIVNSKGDVTQLNFFLYIKLEGMLEKVIKLNLIFFRMIRKNIFKIFFFLRDS